MTQFINISYILKFLIWIFILSSSSCSGHTDWERYRNTGIKKYMEVYFDINFVDEQTGYLSGIDLSGDTPERKYGVYYKTTDGGKNWVRHKLGKGQIKKVIDLKTTLYAVEEIPDGDHYFSILHSSNDGGKNWRVEYRTEHSVTIYKTFTENGNLILVASNGILIRKVGDIWLEIGKLNETGTFNALEFANGKICYLKGGKDITIYDIKYKVETDLIIPSGLKVDLITKDHDNTFYIAGRIQSSTVLFEVDSDLKLKAIHIPEKYREFSPYGLSVYNSTILLIVTTHSSILGVSKKIISSNDRGNTWRSEKIPFSMIIQPFAFYKDKYFWAHNGDESILKRTYCRSN